MPTKDPGAGSAGRRPTRNRAIGDGDVLSIDRQVATRLWIEVMQRRIAILNNQAVHRDRLNPLADDVEDAIGAAAIEREVIGLVGGWDCAEHCVTCNSKTAILYDILAGERGL